MYKIKITLLLNLFILSFGSLIAQTKVILVEHFEKVIISPHIQVGFVQGNKESVTIESISVSEDKLNVEVSGRSLHIYLEGAKTVTKSEKAEDNEYEGKRSIYNGTIVKATVTYKTLEALSLRGDEKFVCKSTLELDKFDLNIYGESEVILYKVKLNAISTTIYGESILEIKSGSIGRQKITAYGESEINTLGVETKTAKITAYGEAEISLMVKDELKVTSYGEASVSYTGNPDIKKGVIIGDTNIKKIE